MTESYQYGFSYLAEILKFAISHSVQSNRLEMGIFDICKTDKIAMQFFVLISIRVIEQITGTYLNS